MSDIRIKIAEDVYTNQVPFVSFEIDPVGHRAWYDRERACVALFREDAIEAAGLANHPKADAVFDMAWEWGQDGGFDGVLMFLEQFAALQTAAA